MDRLAHALRLASLGFLVAPLRPGSKRPYAGESWQEMQTTDPEIIKGWFASRPDMNYSVCPGPHGVIIDLDENEEKGKHGIAALVALDAENFEDAITDQTFTVQTPRGGRHLYLSTPHAVSNRDGGFPNGIDVRGAGGYVVGPLSHTDDNLRDTAEGTYSVLIDAPVMAAPDWVLARLDTTRNHDANAQEALGEEDTEVAIDSVRSIIREQSSWPTEGQGGDRNTYEFIALARNYGAVTQETMFELLNEPYGVDNQSWNEMCDPPWSDADLRRKIENVYAYATSAAGSKGDGLVDEMDSLGEEYINRVDPDLQRDKEGVLGKLDAMCFPGATLTSRKKRREYIIDQWMLAHGMTQLLAFRSTGKSIVMIDLCLRIACDMDWFGNKVAEGWAVVYACGEDDEGMQAEMDAWIAANEVRPEDDRFIVMTGVPDLSNRQECFEWIKFLKHKLNGRRAIFAIDTWQRATSKSSQNDDQHMNEATDMADFIANQLGGPSLIAFHPPKNNMETISGSMLIENKGTAIWKMSADGLVKKLVVDRIKGKGRGNYLSFFFDEVKLPYNDQWGKPETAIVLKKAGDHNGDSPLLKSKTVTVMAHWAQMIHDMMMVEENNTTVFDRGSMAAKLIAWRATNENNDSVRQLARLGEVFNKNERNLQLRLKDIFVTNGKAVPCTDGYNCIYVVGGKRGGHTYVRDSLEHYKAEHPDRSAPAIPMVGEEEPENAIAF